MTRFNPKGTPQAPGFWEHPGPSCPAPWPPRPGSPRGTGLGASSEAPPGSPLRHGEKELSEALGLFLSSAGGPAPAPSHVGHPSAHWGHQNS